MNNPSPSKAETIQLLRTTIEELEAVVKKLDTETEDFVPPKTSVETLLTTTQKLTEAINRPQEIKTTIQETPTQMEEEEITLETPTQIEDEEITPETPAETKEINKKIIALGGAIVVTGVLLIFFWFTQQPQATEEIAIQPPQPQPEISLPSPAIEEKPQVPIAKPVPTPTPPKPQPKLEIIPEQSLIAAIQDQVADITNRYTEELIQSIEANFLASRLIVYVKDDWYELPNSQQEQIANDIFAETQTLDFRKLEISDTQGTLLARSPVVGGTMILFR